MFWSRIGATLLLLTSATLWCSWPGSVPAQTLPSVAVAVTHDGAIFEVIEGGPTSCSDMQSGPGRLVLTVVNDVSFVVSLTGDINQPLEVHLAWGGTAVPGVDYTTAPASVTFTPGTSQITVSSGITPSSGLKTIELTVVPNSGYNVAPDGTAVALINVAVVDPIFCPPPPPPEPNPQFTG